MLLLTLQKSILLKAMFVQRGSAAKSRIEHIIRCTQIGESEGRNKGGCYGKQRGEGAKWMHCMVENVALRCTVCWAHWRAPEHFVCARMQANRKKKDFNRDFKLSTLVTNKLQPSFKGKKRVNFWDCIYVNSFMELWDLYRSMYNSYGRIQMILWW